MLFFNIYNNLQYKLQNLPDVHNYPGTHLSSDVNVQEHNCFFRNNPDRKCPIRNFPRTFLRRLRHVERTSCEKVAYYDKFVRKL